MLETISILQALFSTHKMIFKVLMKSLKNFKKLANSSKQNI